MTKAKPRKKYAWEKAEKELEHLQSTIRDYPQDAAKGIVDRPLKALDSIVDIVLAYRPKPKSKPARRRKRRAAKIAKKK